MRSPSATPPVRTVHVNFEWRSLSDVSYERLSEAEVDSGHINVRDLHSGPNPTCSAVESNTTAPPSVVTTALVPRHMVLKTQAFDRELDVYLRCYHYEFKGCCQRGPRCSFVHVVTLGDGSGPNRRRVKHDRDAPASVMGKSTSSLLAGMPSLQKQPPPAPLQPQTAVTVSLLDAPSGAPRRPSSAETVLTPDKLPCGKAWWFRNPYGMTGEVSATPDPDSDPHNEASMAFSTSIEP